MYCRFSKDVMKKTDIVWRRLNEFLGRGGSEAHRLTEINVDGKLISNRGLANFYNEYFVSLTNSAHNSDCMQYLGLQQRESAFLAFTSAYEIVNIFASIKNSSCCDVDGFQIRPIKHVVDLLAPVLEHIFNCVFYSGKFPKKLQVAKVIVLHKGGDKNVFSNYRPISILPVFSKGLEKLIHVRMTSFLTKHNIITHSQFGFTKGLSTESALLAQKEIILDSFERELCTLGIFIDYSKAFDRINHVTLLKKLSHYGFRGLFLELLESYLNCRQQKVIINNHASDLKEIIAGVPQGSILGPLLFCIYINDLVNIDVSVNFVIYADDSTILLTGRNPSDLVIKANEVLIKLASWSGANSLLINGTKTKAVLFRPKNRKIDSLPALQLENSDIEIVPVVKCLGVLFEEHMSWDAQVKSTAAKISRVSGILCKVQFYLPRSVKLLIYNSLFMSVLNYCYLVWGTTTGSNISQLHKIQKKAVRAIMNAPYDSHTEPLFKELNLYPLPDIYKNTLTKRFEIGVKRKNDFLRTTSRLTLNNSIRDTRFRENWNIPRSRTNYGDQMLRFQLPHVLNE